MARVIINTLREGYGTDQIRGTLTVRELIEYLQEMDEDANVYLSFDRGYTYGGIRYSDFEEWDED